MKSHSLTSFCIISHHPFFSTIRECLYILRRLVEAANDRRRLGSNANQNRESVWSVLLGKITESTPPALLHDVKEIETWILRLLSAPVPVPGKTRVEASPTIHNSYILLLS